MLNALRTWGRNQLRALRPTPGASASTHHSINLNREQRADLVARLRADITRIQHEISDLSDTMPTEPAAASSGQTSRMTELHRQLTGAQRELSRYQARI